MRIGDVMSLNLIRIRRSASLREAAEMFSATQVSDLMVVDEGNNFVGVLSEGDVIRTLLPDYDELIRDGIKFSEAYNVFIANGRTMRDRAIDDLVIRDPITLAPDDQLLKAASTMISRYIHRLPVVENGKLVGTVSRGDLCRAVLAG
jgi:CBS domain-containing protein